MSTKIDAFQIQDLLYCNSQFLFLSLLIYGLFRKTNLKECVKASLIICINNPIVILYFLFSYFLNGILILINLQKYINYEKLRTKFIIFMYENSQKQYRRYFKKKKRQWQFNEEQLLSFKQDSLGRTLGEFYKKHGFRMIPKMENHDVYHLITDCSTNI